MSTGAMPRLSPIRVCKDNRYDPDHSGTNSGMKSSVSHGIYKQSQTDSLRSSLSGSSDRKMTRNKSFILQTSMSGTQIRDLERIYLVSTCIEWNFSTLIRPRYSCKLVEIFSLTYFLNGRFFLGLYVDTSWQL